MERGQHDTPSTAALWPPHVTYQATDHARRKHQDRSWGCYQLTPGVQSLSDGARGGQGLMVQGRPRCNCRLFQPSPPPRPLPVEVAEPGIRRERTLSVQTLPCSDAEPGGQVCTCPCSPVDKTRLCRSVGRVPGALWARTPEGAKPQTPQNLSKDDKIQNSGSVDKWGCISHQGSRHRPPRADCGIRV